MNKSIIWAGVIVIIVGGSIWLGMRGETALGPAENHEEASISEAAEKESLEETGEESQENAVSAPEIREFIVSGENFLFSPASLTVRQGDTVRITFKNTGGFHDLKIPAFGVGTKQISAGSEETIEFVASKAGTFEYYCSVGSHRAMGMTGTLIVQ